MKSETSHHPSPDNTGPATHAAAQDLLSSAMNPRSVAVIGASADPNKVGGRPIDFMLRHGYKGQIYPVNPARSEIQGLRCYRSAQDLPETPDLAIIAVPESLAMAAVQACAARGTRVAVVLTAGFGETGEHGLAVQERMTRIARESGMRLIGPNCQGLANFSCGLVANFSTAFHETQPQDGPVAIVSQSGAASQVIYTRVREQGLGVRYVHATGNEADLTAADLLAAVIEDPQVKVVLLYMEAISHPQVLAAAAERARVRKVPIIAVKAGRTARGQTAASSHTGALASEDRVVDAFLRRHGIQRVRSPRELSNAARWHVEGHRPQARSMFFLSNSGASCVMAADHAEFTGITIADIPSTCERELRDVLPSHANVTNPLDITTALLANPKAIRQTLAVVRQHLDTDFSLISLPVSGSGYDVQAIADDIAAFRDVCKHPVAVAVSQKTLRTACGDRNLAVFDSEHDAMEAFALLANHSALQRRAAPPRPQLEHAPVLPRYEGQFLNEADSLGVLAEIGVHVVEHRLCTDAAQVASALHAMGGRVAIKGCSRDIAHKTEFGLVALNVTEADAAIKHFENQKGRILEAGCRFDGVLVARMLQDGTELALGARLDPVFGPVVLVGAGGVHIEAAADFALLVAPFTEQDVIDAIKGLRINAILSGVRGGGARDTGAVASMAVRLGQAMLAWNGAVASIDINPLFVFAEGQGAAAGDGLVETGRAVECL